MTLEEFKSRLKSGTYKSLVGAKRAISRTKMKEADAKAALSAAKRKLGK